MKLKINRLPFLKILTQVFDGIPAKTPDPNYMNFLLTIGEAEQTILASDGTITIKGKLDAEEETIISSEPGSLEIPARYLCDIIRQLEGDIVTITQVESGVCNITDEISNFNINCVRGEEYPFLDLNFEKGHDFTISGADFINLFETTAFAVATKGPKRHFYGVKVSLQDRVLKFVATDSYRLAEKSQPSDKEEGFSFIVPVKALALVKKYCELKSVTVKEDGNLAYFLVDGLSVACRLYSGEFPNVDRIIPTSTPYLLHVDSRAFISAISRVTIVASEKTQTVRLKCGADSVEVFAKSENVGTASEVIKGSHFEGDNFEICFNYSFVLEAVRALASQEITLAFAGEGKAFIVRSEDPSNIQLITPIRSGSAN